MAGNGKYKYWISKEGLLLIEGWARDGLTDKQIATDKIGIGMTTFYEWLKKYPKFRESLKKGKEVVDRQVENALLRRALGYDYEEITQNKDANGKISTKKITRHMPPDVTAQIFWLKNRKPDIWRDKREIEQTVEDITNPFAGLTEEQLRKLAGELNDD